MPISKGKKLLFDALIQCPDAIVNKGDDPKAPKPESRPKKAETDES